MSDNPSTFSWSAKSAIRKGLGGSTLTVGIPYVSISIPIPEANRDKDAFRNCSNCGRHFNYHRGRFCPN